MTGEGSGAADGPREPSGGTLYVVATPIGNLGDITIRALDVLRAVPLIAAEDTRHTKRLLERYDVATRMTSHHARSGPARLETLLRHLRAGADLAVVTDAGTPGVSDPGGEIVVAWAAEGGTIVPIPGASAVLAAVVASGVAGARWAFEGFLPRTGHDRRDRMARIAADHRATIVYEAPTRVAATLRDLAAACGPDRPGAVCRELTKVHETVTRASLGELAGLAESGGIPARGEFALVVGAAFGSRSGLVEGDASDDALKAARDQVEALVASGIARGDAARRVSATSRIPRRSLYGHDEPR